MLIASRSSGKTDRVTAILDVAARRLNARGVSEEWFGDIATDLNITRPALYSHFEDRDELLFACYLRTIETLEAKFVEVATIAPSVVDAYDAFLAATISEDFPELAVVAEIDVLPTIKRDVIAARRSALVDRIAHVATQGQRGGIFKQLDPRVIAQSLLGLATWSPLQRRLLPGRPTASVLSGAREILFHGIASDRKSDRPMAPPIETLSGASVNLFDRASIAAAKREHLLGVASGLFNRRGVGATRVEEIAEAVGSNKRAIYRQFGSKDQLVAQCFERANAINLRIAADAVAANPRRIDALHFAVRRVALSLGDRIVPSLTSHVGLGRLAHDQQVKMQGGFAALESAYRDMLQQGIDEGSVRDLPINDVVTAMAGTLHWIASASPSASSVPLERAAAELADLNVYGIAI